MARYKSSKPVESSEPGELTDKQALTLSLLHSDFESERVLHEGLHWSPVFKAIIANRDRIKGVYLMEKYGHRPNVFSSDRDGFYIGTCAVEPPPSTRNYVYDQRAAELAGKSMPMPSISLPAWQTLPSGVIPNALDSTASMGITLMDTERYYALQSNGPFDMESRSLLLTPDWLRKQGLVNAGYYTRETRAQIDNISVLDCRSEIGWRGMLKFNWVS